MQRSKHLFVSIILSTIALLSTQISAANTPSKEEQLSTEQQIRQLQNEIATLKKQFQIVNRNQQAIAKHIGLEATGKQNTQKQPTLQVGNSASIGNKDADVVLMEFTDLHCPFCKKFQLDTFEEINKAYIQENTLRFVGKHYPITAIHKKAFSASLALECARKQENSEKTYKKAKTWLFEEGASFKLDKFSEAFELDKSAFDQCIKSPEVAKQINDDINLAKSLGINQTPSFLIGLQTEEGIKDWRIIVGSKKPEQFAQAIDKFIEQAKSK